MKVTYRVRLTWWASLYLFGVELFSQLTWLEPDYEKVGAIIGKGLRLEEVSEVGQ